MSSDSSRMFWSPKGDPGSGVRFWVTTRRWGDVRGRTPAVRRALGLRGLHTVRQVHGRGIVSAASARTSTPADGILLTRPGQAAMIRAADCAPVLLYHPAGRRACLLHAGWRGLAAGIVEAGLVALRSDPEDGTRAWIGPHIRECCYTLGPEAAASFGRPAGRFSLEREIRRRLRLAGISARSLHGGAPCTGCSRRNGGSASPAFYSWRARRETERMAAVAVLE